MLLYYDLDAGQWVQSPGSRFSPARPGFIRGDSAAIMLKFCRGATVVELDAAATARLGVKQDGKFDGSYLASTTTVLVANHSKAITSTVHGTVTTFLVPGHGRATGESVMISGDTSTPPANGTFPVTVTDADHFSVPFTTTVDGAGGTMTPVLEPSYSFAPSFNTAAIDTALGVQGGGGSTGDDVSALACNLEVTWTVAGVIASTARLPVTIWNDVNKGDEGAADYSNPSYPAPNNVVTAYPLITGLTGGTATDLDGQVTVGGARLAGHVAGLRIDTTFSWWRLRVRTGEVEGARHVIPDDDATLVWEEVDGADTFLLSQISNMSPDARVFNAAPNNAGMRTALGVVPQAKHEVDNRFTADHSSWKLGDIVVQTAPGTPEIRTYEFSAPDPFTYGGTFTDGIDSTGWTEGYGSREYFAQNLAGNINSDLSFIVTATSTGPTVTVTWNDPGVPASSFVASDFVFGTLTETVVTPGDTGVQQVVDYTFPEWPLIFRGTSFGDETNSYTTTSDLAWDTVAADFAALINSAGLTVSASVVADDLVVESSIPGVLGGSGNWSVGTSYWNSPFWVSETVTQSGADAPVAPGSFIVTDVTNLDNATGYEVIGNTVDFLSGYGVPGNEIGELGNGYINLNNGDFYRREEAQWTLVMNIKGPQGNTGGTGATGATGAVGPGAGELARIALLFPPAPTTVGVGAACYDACFDGTHIWVANYGGNSLTKIVASTGVVVGTYSIGTNPYGICWDGTYIWASGFGSGTVKRVNASTGAVLASVTVGAGAYGLAFNGTHIWCANYSANTVTKINASTDAVVSTTSVGTSPYGVCWDGTYIGVSNQGGNSVSRIVASTGAVNLTVSVGATPQDLIFDGTHVWVVCRGGPSLYKILASSGAVVGSTSCPSQCYGLIFDGTNLWITSLNGNTISKWSRTGTAGALITAYATGAGPIGAVFDGSSVWATNYSAATVTRVKV